MTIYPKLFVYARALDAAEECEQIARAAMRARPDLSMQLRRASASIALNIAEGTGEFSRAEKMRFYRMAKRSAYESDAALDLIERTVREFPPLAKARGLIAEVVGLLTNTIKAIDGPRS